MADRILFLGWNRPVAGRDQQAMQLFQKSMEIFGGLQSKGLIESFEPVILSSHGGDLNGYIMIRTDADKLSEVRKDDTFFDFTIEARYCLDGFGVIPGYIGEGINDLMTRWAKLISE